MALIMQPSWLPEPLRDGYALKQVSPLLRSTFVSGRSMQRRRYTSTPTEVGVRWLLDSPTAALFEKWFQQVLMDGSGWFACRLRTPLGMEYYKTRFMDIYDGPALTQSNDWLISANLELYERPLLEDGWLEMPYGYLQASIIDKALNREWPKG